ncbi:D-aminoacyl-tRNA deacylase [Mangrovicoccus sp. HB161399]|uniref:D-aminoacyl-tRNA deacylase n=1 Tax=Mangrovicoccus sp. HB161399 TaxID=2720392 RepID=UPI0015575407|nr:D-aminoacyl-tRNA deacylase [Mangrovicoccus sp. HB161399]
MRLLIQRVAEARVEVGGEVKGRTGPGLLVLACAMAGDTEEVVAPLAAKVSKLRIFEDAAGKMNRSVLDVSGGILVVSQFTLAADTRRGNRPGFSAAAPPETGRRLYEQFARELSALGIPVETGVFGADMQVHLVNDGPVTIWMDTEDRG